MKRRVPGISKIKALTGYTPTVDLRQALSFTRDWLLRQKELDAPVYPTAPLYAGGKHRMNVFEHVVRDVCNDTRGNWNPACLRYALILQEI
jgi:hypothetical protein